MDQDTMKSKLLERFEKYIESFKDTKDMNRFYVLLGKAGEILSLLYVTFELIDYEEYKRLNNELDVAVNQP